ncbi:uroporphyrinogen III decarboxylase, putative [Hepatocystis sp. ex Piliocolobus tephrosceles]|nr:uroporphyrinogen III decarboxylase, putative [Hepatocystis sp. ex Piliocolobus tephrosceles]
MLKFVLFLLVSFLLGETICFINFKKLKLGILKMHTELRRQPATDEVYIRPENSKYEVFGPPQNDLLLRVIGNKDKEKYLGEIPFWIMRQAGRYLPEYIELRKKHDFFEICFNPELSSEVTIMPYKRFKCDMVVIFSDILIIFVAMGVGIDFKENVGPVFNKEINNLKDFKKLNLNLKDIINNLHFVYDSIYLTKKKMNNVVPVLGFAGSPFTLFTYLTKNNKKTYENSLKLIYEHPNDTHTMLKIITNICTSHLINQIDSGSNVIQIFDSNADIVDKDFYKEFSLFYLKKVIDTIKELRPHAYIILFIKENYHEDIKHLKADVLSLTHKQLANMSSQFYYKLFNNNIILQGALDPHILLLEEKKKVEKYTSKMIDQIDFKNKYIASLGHGILPNSKIENVHAFIQTVKSYNVNNSQNTLPVV